jgi:hypothetical protein
MNHLTKVKHIQKLNEEELKRGIGISSSWHTKVYLGLIIASIKTVRIFMREDSHLN